MYKLDHIVLGASSLDDGTRFVENKLDTMLSDIGYHDFMGTHNRVLKIDRNVYLEVISINPRGKKPSCPRWFNLDNETVQEKIKKKPKIIGYVIESKDRRILKYYNPFIRASRGNYKWDFAMPNFESKFLKDKLIENGVIPSLINWKGKKPIDQMQVNQFSIDKFEIQILKNQNQYKDFIDTFGYIQKLMLSVGNSFDKLNTDCFPLLNVHIKDNKKNKIIVL